MYDWFYTNGIYTSLHDLITRILQLDVDGDQLNVITNKTFIDVAERNAKEFDFVPLYYDAGTAEPEILSFETMFNGLKRAHDFSSGGITSIGEISNMLTRVWDKPNPDRNVTKLLCYFNNLVIDAAKSGKINHYKNYPKIARRIGKATGGKNGPMPAWFVNSKNQRKLKSTDQKKYADTNNSTMNRICKTFEDIGNINMNFAGIPQFNWQMLLEGPCVETRPEIPLLFCEMNNQNQSNLISSGAQYYSSDREKRNGIEMTAEDIVNTFTEKFGSLENAYPYVVKFLFGGEGMNRSSHKQMFWKVFGDIALRNIKKNMTNYRECDKCRMRIPDWIENHVCSKASLGFFECIDCGQIFERTNSRQCRCSFHQEQHKKELLASRQKKYWAEKKEAKEQRITRLHSSSTET